MSYTVTQGEDVIIPHIFTTTDDDGETIALDLTDCYIWWTLKSSYNLSDEDAELNHWWSESDEQNISLTDPESSELHTADEGLLYNHLTAEETTDLELNTHYHYDLWLRDANGLDRQIETGYLHARTAVRQRTTLAP